MLTTQTLRLLMVREVNSAIGGGVQPPSLRSLGIKFHPIPIPFMEPPCDEDPNPVCLMIQI